MSDQNPPENGPTPDGTEPTAPLTPASAEPTAQLPLDQTAEAQFPATDPLAAQAASPATPVATSGRGRRRTAIIALVAIVVVAVLGGGAFAAWKVFFSGGPRPAEALPASTIAYLSIDLDPSAGQKIAAIKTIRKFPTLKDKLGLNTQDDLRKFIVDKITEASGCKDVDFNTDVKPWIGKRAAVAAVDLGAKNPVPAIAIQVTDQKKAQSGFSKLANCGDFGSDFGFVVGKDYLIASDSAEHAKTILVDGEKKPLSDDSAYKKWTDRAGDQGVVNFYVAKKAASYLSEGLDQLKNSFGDVVGGSASGGGGLSIAAKVPQAECSDDPFATAQDQLKNFEGLAGTLRFAGGGMELSMVAQGIDQLTSTGQIGPDVTKLPADSAIVAGLGIPKGYASTMFDSFTCGAGSSAKDFIAEAEQRTGLKLPGDLETLLGSGLTISLGGDAPADLSAIDDPSGIPVGLAVHGDSNKIKDLIATMEGALDFRLSDVPIEVKNTDSKLVLSPSSAYADSLLADGKLGDSSNFSDAVPNAGKASGIFYVNFDSAWRDTLLKFAADQGASADDIRIATENTAPLKSLGLSTWTDGSTSHILLKLSTD